MDNAPETTAKKPSSKKIAAAVLGAAVLIGAGYLISSKTAWFPSGSAVAVVNGEKVEAREIESRFGQYKQLYGAQIPNIDDPQVSAEIKSKLVDEVVNEVLISQHAKKQGFEVSDEEVTNAMSALKAQYESESAYEANLKSMGYTENSAEDVVRRGLYIEKFIADFTIKENATASDAEINALYDQVSQGKADFPKLEDIRKEVEGEVKRQKIAQKILALLDELKLTGDIKVL